MPGPFSYLNNIPAATDQLSVSQGQIQTNFASTESLVDVDHVDFNSVNAGMHNTVTLPLFATNATYTVSPPYSTTNFILYNVANAAPFPAVNQLWINNPTNLAVTAIPLAASILNSNAAPGVNSSGYTYLPSGLIIQWGYGTTSTNFAAPTTFNFSIAFPNMCIQVMPTAKATQGFPTTDPNTVVYTVAVGLGSFTAIGVQRIGSTAVAANFNYLAIGY